MTKPNIIIPNSFAANGDKTDFDESHITNGFPTLTPDILRGDNLNKFIDDTYKGLNGVLELYKGAVLYDVTETYSDTSIVFYIDTNDNNKIKIYHSLQNSNTGNPLTDTDYWEEVELGGGANTDLSNLTSIGKDNLVTIAQEVDFTNSITVSTSDNSGNDQSYTCLSDGIMYLMATAYGGATAKNVQVLFPNSTLDLDSANRYGTVFYGNAIAYDTSIYKYCKKNETVTFVLSASGGGTLNAVKAVFVPFKKG